MSDSHIGHPSSQEQAAIVSAAVLSRVEMCSNARPHTPDDSPAASYKISLLNTKQQ